MTLVECMIAVAIAAILVLATLSALAFARVQNSFAQERVRAHQIVSQKLEIERYHLFTWTGTGSQQTIWDNQTPGDTSDDTIGTLEIEVRDAATGAVYTSAPNPATLLEIEATLTWNPRGPRLGNKTFRESAITYKAP